MIQHPIPQNISTYQFRLVGDMTLKQFLELVGGLAVGALFYYSNLFGPLKLIFVILAALTGFALAFMPVEERPLDQWLLAFIRAIYAPTLFIWRKTTTAPSFFSFIPHSTPLTTETQEMMAAQVARKKAGLSSFLMTLPQSPAIDSLEAQESTKLDQVLGYFLASPKPLSEGGSSRPITRPVSIPQTPTITATSPIQIIRPTPVPTAWRPAPLASPKPLSEGGTPKPTAGTNTISIPDAAPVQVTPTQHSPSLVTNTSPLPAEDPTKAGQPQGITTVATKISPTTTAANPQKDLPFPSPPQTPNTVVGMILAKGDAIIDNAIIEIRDRNGIPVRATKTNRLGQFFSTTPLKNGSYEVEVEAPGHTFTVVKLNLTGKIVDPLKIQSSN